MHILLVDDDADVLIHYQSILHKAFPKARYICAPTGAIALDICCRDEIEFSLILTDYKMPVMDGKEFLIALRHSESRNKSTPSILISGYLSEVDQASFENLVIHQLEKPVRKNQLIEVCSLLLGV
jgi:CheY-like chemotaxis protein